MLVSITAAIFFVAVYLYFKSAHRYWQSLGVSTLAPQFPFGNVFRVLFRFESINEKVCEVYATFKGSKCAGMYFFSRKVFVALDRDLIKRILCQDFQHFNDRGIYYDEHNDPVSAHLFSLSGEKWRCLRTKLTPAFTPAKIKYMFGSIKMCADQMIDLLDGFMREDGSGCLEIKEVLARFTTDVIGSCAFGIECNSLTDPDAQFRQMGRRAFTQTPADAFKMVIIRSFPSVARLLKLGVFAPNVSRFFRDVVHDTIQFRAENNVSRRDFLQLLMQIKESDGGLSEDEIAAQAFIFFLAGFETTSATISFALLEMALNPGIQERARSELLAVLGKHFLSAELTFEDLAELNYLETVVLESLRKYPPAPVFLRKCTRDYIVPGTEVIVRKGISTLIPAMALHRDPEYFPMPEKFDPDRFSEDNKHKIKEYTYLPFGDGPRICIGMKFAMVQAKLALALILQKYTFTLSSRTVLPLEMEKKGIVLTPIGGIWLELRKL